MDRDLTDLTLVIDRSGSMQARRADAEGGVNAFLADQRTQPGRTDLTLVQFDTEYEFVHRGKDIRDAGPYTLVPRGGTALLDALGRAIQETGERLRSVPEHRRPGLVVFVVVTDGEENSSREYTREKVREMVRHQQDKYAWQFTFLGAGIDSFAQAGGLGIRAAGVANFAPGNYAQAYGSASANIGRMRRAAAGGACGQSLSAHNAFTPQEQADMAGGGGAQAESKQP